MTNTELLNDERIHASYQGLIKLKSQIKNISFYHPKIKTSKLSGRHGSKLRGRGVDFEEIKNYRKGDDVKSIDWKLTLRTGTPYIRSYTEEKDRNVLVCVDQSQSMFFSSVSTMKSVVAAEVASLCIWKMLSNNNKVGSLIAKNNAATWFTPKRGERSALQFLKELSFANESLLLNEKSSLSIDEFKIEQKVDELLKRKVRSSVIFLISDFYDLSNDIVKKIKKLQHTNDVICIHVFDKLEKEWNEKLNIVLSDGEMQFSSAGKDEKIKTYFNQYHKEKQENLILLSKINNLPFFELNTNGDHINQLFAQLNGV